MSTGLLKKSSAKNPKKLKVSHNVSLLSALPWIGPALVLIILVVISPGKKGKNFWANDLSNKLLS